jgi:hypothetical protein
VVVRCRRIVSGVASRHRLQIMEWLLSLGDLKGFG